MNLGQTDKPANLYTSPLRTFSACTRMPHLQDIAAVGHSFPEVTYYITCHYRFSDALDYKKNGLCSPLSARSKAKGEIGKNLEAHAGFRSCFFMSKGGFLLRHFHPLASIYISSQYEAEAGSQCRLVAGTEPVRFAYA